MSIESTVIMTAAVAWFAHGWYLNSRLASVHAKLDRVLVQFDGLREYLYEIDPQFDDERALRAAFENGDSVFAGLDEIQLLWQKESAGKRTLKSPLVG